MRTSLFASLPLVVLIASSTFSCGTTSGSSIVVAISSEAPPGEAIDAIDVVISADGQTQLKEHYVLTANQTQLLPGTLVVSKQDDTSASTPVSVVVQGSQNGTPRVTRRATLAFVEGKQKLLRMPLQIACFGVDCAEGETCKEGACTPAQTDGERLPEFSEGRVFGKRNLGCFDRDECIDKTRQDLPIDQFVKTRDTTLPNGRKVFEHDEQKGTCSLVGDGQQHDQVNMGLVWNDLPDYWVSVDFDADEGWQFDPTDRSRFTLSPGLCRELAKPQPRIRSLVTAVGCQPKPAILPECEDTVGK